MTKSMRPESDPPSAPSEASEATKKTPDFPVVASAASGKPYDWGLARPEERPFIALSPEAMAERTDEETAAVFKSAVERTAAFLVVVSRNNGYEGRDPAIITDDLDCGTVAGMLHIDIDMLAGVLVELKSRGLVTPSGSGSGLQLRNIDALDRLSDGL